MAQIIKHRRGSLTQLKDVTARIGEIVVATGSIGDLNGPLVFVGETEGVGGAYRTVSKIYQGTTAPTLTIGSHGSVIDGTPFYASSNKSLYVLSKDGNNRLDLTGNIEGNTITSVTISGLTGTTATIQNVSGSFTGSGQGLYNIPASGITGLELNRISEGSATASISEAGGLRVNTKTEITGALIVTGDISGSNLQLSGNANINGNIFLGGNITVGDSDTDFVKFDAEISSSIVPDVHNAFDLGSSSKNWRNLHVSGTAYVDTLEARQVNFSDLGILEDLTVSGNTFLGNGGDITVISGSVYNDQLTEKRMVVVGAQGLLTDYSGLTFDNGNLNLSGALEVTNIQGTGSLYLQADKNDARYFEIYNTAPTDVHIKSNGGLSFFGDDTNYLKIDDNLQTATIVGVNGVSVSSSLNLTGSLNGTDASSNWYIAGNGFGETYIQSSTGNLMLEAIGEDAEVTVKTGNFRVETNAIVDGTLQVGEGSFEVDTNGNIRTSGSLLTNGLTNNGDLTVNGVLTVTGNTQLQSNLYVSGNLEVLGSATSVIIQSQTVEIDDNIIRLNAYAPFERYAGLEVIDSGSTNLSASLLWDGLNDYWLFMSSSGQSSKLIGTTAGTYGSELSLTTDRITKATGTSTIGDSLLSDNATTLAYNTNKFTVAATDGATLIAGNVTLSSAGGTDGGSNTTSIVFKNSSNILGYVSTIETTDVLDGILGYKSSDGALVFSTVIDGGSY